MGFIYVAITILFTVAGQVLVKWQMSQTSGLPAGLEKKLYFFAKLMLNPWIILVFVLAYLASLSWMAAMTKLPLSYAYPFTSIGVMLVFVIGVVFFKEAVHPVQLVGISLIILGLCCLGYMR